MIHFSPSSCLRALRKGALWIGSLVLAMGVLALLAYPMRAPILRAIAGYHQPRSWRRLQINGMKKDFSWDRSAAEYLKVYKRVIAARRKTGSSGVSRATRSTGSGI